VCERETYFIFVYNLIQEEDKIEGSKINQLSDIVWQTQIDCDTVSICTDLQCFMYIAT